MTVKLRRSIAYLQMLTSLQRVLPTFNTHVNSSYLILSCFDMIYYPWSHLRPRSADTGASRTSEMLRDKLTIVVILANFRSAHPVQNPRAVRVHAVLLHDD